MNECSVCKDEFSIGDKYIQMPCKHPFHSTCILPWLENHNSCPTCRYELKTDDSDYEQRKQILRNELESRANQARMPQNNLPSFEEREMATDLPGTVHHYDEREPSMRRVFNEREHSESGNTNQSERSFSQNASLSNNPLSAANQPPGLRNNTGSSPQNQAHLSTSSSSNLLNFQNSSDVVIREEDENDEHPDL